MAVDPKDDATDLGSLLGGFPAIDDTTQKDAMKELMGFQKMAQKNPLTEEQIAELMRIQAQSGANFTVDSSAAPQFQGFIKDLEATGYKIDPNQSSGYANRNIAGTNKLSKHATGQAIDINWTNNPEGSSAHDFPANVQQIADKHGLVWGNNWTGRKRGPDAMHFEIGTQKGPQMAQDPNQPVQQAQAPAQPTFQIPRPQRAADQQNMQESGGSWSDWLQKPENRSFLIGTGLQLMVPQWGNPMSQIGQALGNGVASAAGNVEAQRANEMQDLKMGNEELDRRSREKVAEQNNASRSEVANIKTAAMLDRTRMIQGAKNANEGKVVETAMNKYMGIAKQGQLLSGKSDAEIEAEAHDYAMKVLAASRSANGVTAPEANAGDTTSGKTPPTAAKGSTAQAPKGENLPADKKGKAATWEEAIKLESVQNAVKTPEGRAYLEQKWPQFRKPIGEWIKANPSGSVSGGVE